MNKTKRNVWQIAVVCMLVGLLTSYIFVPTGSTKVLAAPSNTVNRYCDDGPSGGEGGITPYGIGTTVVDDKTIYYDYKQIVDDHRVFTAPSYGNTDHTMYNTCGPMAGTNIIGFYDRYYKNLIPNFEPGIINYGSYEYFGDFGFQPVKNTTKSLYTLMKTNVSGAGASKADWKNGLTSYANQRGYSLSYSSFFNNTKTVNLSALATAIGNNKVGAIFCNTYNYVYSIVDSNTEGLTIVNKNNSTAAHIMMVYGYQIIAYYKDGTNFQTDTYLQVSSGYGTANQGYIKMNDYLSIDDAIIIDLS